MGIIDSNTKLFVLGAEAIGAGAVDSGISGVYSYPGTPATEITEYIQRAPESEGGHIRSEWSVNEKTAYEAGLGMSYAGRRTLVCMKHVGLNVAADPFLNSGLTGVLGGLVLAVADDPSMHSSQNEQDTRFYAKFAQIPMLEPSDQQEVYDSVRYGFTLSEETKLPVIIRLTTRLSHSRAVVIRKKRRAQSTLKPESDRKRWILLPDNARTRHSELTDFNGKLREYSEASGFNRIKWGAWKTGVIAFGIAYNYVMEAAEILDTEIPVLKVSHYPVPEGMIRRFCRDLESILVAEEGYPVYEELIRGVFRDPRIHGRLDRYLPGTGELNTDLIMEALGQGSKRSAAIQEAVPNRPPELCMGCGHRDLFESLRKAVEEIPDARIFSDIGCYTLGAMPPYEVIDTCVNMGASISMAKGAWDAGLDPSLALIGDSTFTHSGITGLLEAVNEGSGITVVISDNSATAMTGGQFSHGTGRLYRICRGIGVEKEHLIEIAPVKKRLRKNTELIKKEIEFKGVSVIIAKRECIRAVKQEKRPL